jgi:hypothetical protein
MNKVAKWIVNWKVDYPVVGPVVKGVGESSGACKNFMLHPPTDVSDTAQFYCKSKFSKSGG